MLRKDITYTDINDVTRTEPFYFHFTELELNEVELELGGIQETMRKLEETSDIKKAYHIFKDLVLAGYGKKAADGKGFDKEDPDTGRPYRRELLGSPALSVLIIDLMADVQEAAAFFRGMLPTDIQKKAEALEAEQVAETPAPVQADLVAPPVEKSGAEGIAEKKLEEFTRDELLEMPQQQFDALVGTNPREMKPDVLAIAYQRKTSS